MILIMFADHSRLFDTAEASDRQLQQGESDPASHIALLRNDFGEGSFLAGGSPDAAHVAAVNDESAVRENRGGGKTWQGSGQ